MQKIEINRRLGEVVVVKYPGVLSVEAAARIKRAVQHALSTGEPLVVDRGIEIEAICTPATMNADLWQRLGDA